MKLIPLSAKHKCKNKSLNLFAIVDDEDYDYLMKFSWQAHKLTSGYYAHGYGIDPITKKRKNKIMHRIIMNAPKDLLVDHINHDCLDNRKCNLRLATKRQNNSNVKSAKNSTSKYLGVHRSIHERTSSTGRFFSSTYWMARCRSNKKYGKKNFLFPYTPEGEILAAKKYDELAKEAHGEFANLNFKE